MSLITYVIIPKSESIQIIVEVKSNSGAYSKFEGTKIDLKLGNETRIVIFNPRISITDTTDFDNILLMFRT